METEIVRKRSVQKRAKKGEKHSLFSFLVRAGELITPWWAPQRDIDLEKMVKECDHLSGAVYTLESKIATIPLRIQPRDRLVRTHVKLAKKFEENLLEGSEFGRGWMTFAEKATRNFTTQDNGFFAEIIGDGDPEGPIQGMPYTIAVLDPSRCTRTGDPEFPVKYTDTDGKQWKLHYTRVVFRSQMESTIETMNGVGFCAVSRCINNVRILADRLIFMQEKLGSRPARNILVTKGGLSPKDVGEAFKQAEETMSNLRLKRYSKTVVVGNKVLKDAGIDQVDLSTLQDGFNEKESTEVGMAMIALAFGMDARELWPAMSSGATKAEALVQHLKQRGKGPGNILQMFTTLLNQKYLPPSLEAVFDYQDDEQDREVAEIKEIRHNYWNTALNNKTLDEQTIRQQMLEEGEITKGQFEDLELKDGRLDDGAPALSLFFNPDYAMYLNVGVVDPLDRDANDVNMLKPVIVELRLSLIKELGTVEDPAERIKIKQSIGALDALEKYFVSETRPLTQPPEAANAPVPASPAQENLRTNMRTGIQGSANIQRVKDLVNRIWGHK